MNYLPSTFENESKLFHHIWKTRDKISMVSGANLRRFENTNFFFNLFAHVIPKNGHNRLIFHDKALKNKLLRLNPMNVVLLTPKEHYLIDHGTKDKRKEYEQKYKISFAPFYDYKEELIKYIKNEIEKNL